MPRAVDTAPTQDSRRTARAAAALVALVALWQFADAGAYGLGTDEAHYALYATRLDTGYFSASTPRAARRSGARRWAGVASDPWSMPDRFCWR